MNELEQRLRQVPLKPAPADWRRDIVGQASSLSAERVSVSSPLRQALKTLPPSQAPVTRPSERGIHAASAWMARNTHEILRAVGVLTPHRTEVRAPAQSAPVRLHAQLHALLWPHPKAWAGLAAAWMAILVLNLSQRDVATARVETSAPPSPEIQAELRAQQRMFVELLGPPMSGDLDRPRLKPPQPRTQFVKIMMV